MRHHTCTNSTPIVNTHEYNNTLAYTSGKVPTESELEGSEECLMHDADLQTMGAKDSRGGYQYDDDDDEEGEGGPGIQCAQQ